jgi:hypothetical protein
MIAVLLTIRTDYSIASSGITELACLTNAVATKTVTYQSACSVGAALGLNTSPGTSVSCCCLQDKINAFWEITKKELEDRKAEMRNQDRQMEEMEDLHQRELKVLTAAWHTQLLYDSMQLLYCTCQVLSASISAMFKAAAGQ